MDMISHAQLQMILPLAQQRVGSFIDPLNSAMQEADIVSAVRQAAFLAQVAHESAELLYTRELATGQDEELVQARKAEIAKLLQLIADSPVRYSWHDVAWTKDDQAFALSLLRPLLRDRTHIDPRAVLDHIRQPILDRYRRWLVAQDDFRRRNCWDPKGPWHMDGVMGLLVEAQTKLHPEMDPCHSWFADARNHANQITRAPRVLSSLRDNSCSLRKRKP